MVPCELIAIADRALETAGDDRWSACCIHVFDIRQTVSEQCAAKGAEKPMRMRNTLPQKPRARFDRNSETIADIVLAISGDRNVRGQHERLVSRGENAVYQRLNWRILSR